MTPQTSAIAVVGSFASNVQPLPAVCAKQYDAGRSIHELAELTGRSHSAVRRALDQAGVPRRGRGALAVARR
ncbi:hypothetical protein GCM10022399_43840 [Terrabacter ginsenosidimutans]|uniref:Helix-turn-helix domain-containing protein n=1 Tax=Terrabacter ginsenosidimutans TaxID=490575 RepID=A0ABP7EQC5_9MICO